MSSMTVLEGTVEGYARPFSALLCTPGGCTLKTREHCLGSLALWLPNGPGNEAMSKEIRESMASLPLCLHLVLGFWQWLYPITTAPVWWSDFHGPSFLVLVAPFVLFAH